MDAPLASLRRAAFRLAEQGTALSALYHRARLLGREHLPLKGPVPLVGSHGVWGYETPAFFHLIHRGTGRHHWGLTERGFFRIPLIRMVLPWLLRWMRDILATDQMPRRHELQVPTLVIQGGRDLLVSPRAAHDVARHIPGARLAPIRGASRLPYMSQRDAFNTLAGASSGSTWTEPPPTP
ncbi:hypothetical protein [Myxococcus xanthus]|uniref:hypothetical protein n=1 Tax=Myxococcus xanthus TaxID=34 RepID=UPI0020A4A22A|nr:hypothetical protein [Myxococcus xanthus]